MQLIGVAYIGIGSWLVDGLKVKSGIDLVNENYTSMAGIMITVGCLCVINSFIGFMLLIVAEKLFAFIFVSSDSDQFYNYIKIISSLFFIVFNSHYIHLFIWYISWNCWIRICRYLSIQLSLRLKHKYLLSF